MGINEPSRGAAGPRLFGGDYVDAHEGGVRQDFDGGWL